MVSIKNLHGLHLIMLRIQKEKHSKLKIGLNKLNRLLKISHNLQIIFCINHASLVRPTTRETIQLLQEKQMVEGTC